MKSRKAKLFLSVGIGALLFAGLWLSIHGISRTIDKTVSVNVYENDDWSHTTSSIKIAGDRRKTLFSTSFVGTFAIDCYEPTCREGAEAKIRWEDGYQNITFFYAGDFSRLDIEMIEIDEDMEHLMLVLKDGTIITSPDYYIPTQVWKKYKQ